MTYVGLPMLDRRSNRVDAAKERRPLRSSWRAAGVTLEIRLIGRRQCGSVARFSK